MQLDEGVSSPAREPIEEAPQGGRIRIPWQADQVVKHAVVAQGFSGLDPAEAQDQRVEQRLQGFADAVAVVPLCESDALGKETLQPDPLEKLLEECHSAELGQPQSVDADTQISRSTSHYIQTSLLVRFACNSQDTPSDRSVECLLWNSERS